MKTKFFYIIFALSLSSISLFAVKAYPGLIEVTQPDGTNLTIRLKGDEFFNYTTTEDGYLIRRDETGVFRYAKFQNGNFELSTHKATNILNRNTTEKKIISQLEKNPNLNTTLQQRKLQKISKVIANTNVSNQFPVTGSPHSLVILVNFSDKSYVTPSAKTAFTNLLNQTGYSINGGTGSARDYFIESSYGQFSPQFDVVGPYTLPNNMSFYGKNNASGDDENPQQMVIDACAAADAAGIDFKQYDIDNNGIVDNIFVYYAGNNEAEGADANTVWPHRWSLNDYNTKFDGKTIFDYACTSELNGSSGSKMCGIGTFTHEFGHVLGLVDYYHTSDNNKLALENWSIMDGGAYNNVGRTPPTYSAFDRFYLGWLTPIVLSNAQNITLNPLISSNKACLIAQNSTHNLIGNNPSPTEFFMVENRYRTGFDSYLPGEGLLIWHIDFNQSDWDNNSPNNYSGTYQTASSHMGVYLQPVIGNSTTPGSAFPSGSFYPSLWNGADINKPITEITKYNRDIKFKFRGGNFEMLPPIANEATDLTSKSFVANWTTVENATKYWLTAYSLADGESTETEGFDSGLQSNVDWSTSATAVTSSKNFSGKAIPAIQFQSKDEYIKTLKYPHSVTQLSFFIKSIGSESGIVEVKAANELGWTIIDEIALNANFSTIKKYDFSVDNNYNQFIIGYKTAHNNVAIDDITVTYPVAIEYICKSKLLLNNTDTLRNLVSARQHFYKVKAGDSFDNITDFSNLIPVQPLPYPDTKVLRVERLPNSTDILVFLKNTNYNILIYNTIGSLIALIKPTDLKVNISNYLHKHNL
ncbi:MAG: M6 family metalloprotease domain-containing protein, partial [Paludibacter sp.]